MRVEPKITEHFNGKEKTISLPEAQGANVLAISSSCAADNLDECVFASFATLFIKLCILEGTKYALSASVMVAGLVQVLRRCGNQVEFGLWQLCDNEILLASQFMGGSPY